ncbi:MAG: hypothetical protein U5Q16_08455 [Gammaproteobacteria bacterium]|nr:hypothetical protein [Gammaproteobacteria bacterium]
MKHLSWLALLALTAAGCAQVQRVDIPDTVPELRPGILQGYLDPQALPDSAALVPPPPADGSAAQARDQEASAAALALRGTPRWDLAAADAVLMFPEAARTPSPARSAPASPSRRRPISTGCCIAPSPTWVSRPTPPKSATSVRGRSW